MNKIDAPLVSAILITYNSARFVTETLESIKAQTWKNIELIVCDDGSTDATVQICTEWLEKNKDSFPTVKILASLENTGIPANCNRGFRASTGEWVKIVSGDDILLESAFADNLAYAVQFPDASFIASDVKEIDENGGFIRDGINNEGLVHISSMSSAKKQTKAYSRWPAFLNTPTFFIRRSVFEKTGFCDEEFRIYEDMPMVIKLLQNGFKLHHLKKDTLAYRVHKEAASRSLKLNVSREKEARKVFKKYQRPHLKYYNLLDLSVFYESWLRFTYSGAGLRGGSILRKISLHYWYMKSKGIKTY